MDKEEARIALRSIFGDGTNYIDLDIIPYRGYRLDGVFTDADLRKIADVLEKIESDLV